MELAGILGNEETRRREFPVVAHRVFMAHAAVSPLPRAAVAALADFAEQGSRDHQESGYVEQGIGNAREAAAELLGCSPLEIALLGPTSLGLNIVADGLPWRAGDEVVYYGDDYPANVYPWTKLADRGVKALALRPARTGVITWELIEGQLTARTRLVALATCHYLSGYRLDVDTIGRRLGERGILFCLDGIQSLGAFPLSVEHVDFLCADSHKWLLGPLGAGVLYVKKSLQDRLRPPLLGAWNVRSPDFIAQERIEFYDGARRYEPGALNVPGILAMMGSLRFLLQVGIEAIGRRILDLRERLVDGAHALGYSLCLEDSDLPSPWGLEARSGIVSLTHPRRGGGEIYRRAVGKGVSLSLRLSRDGSVYLRVSPHFYNTEEEVQRLLACLA